MAPGRNNSEEDWPDVIPHSEEPLQGAVCCDAPQGDEGLWDVGHFAPTKPAQPLCSKVKMSIYSMSKKVGEKEKFEFKFHYVWVIM